MKNILILCLLVSNYSFSVMKNNPDVEIESILTFQNKTTTNGPVNVSGVIGEDTTWYQENSPYIVTGNILVPSGIVLTIEPGVIVKFNEDLYIKVEGTIKAVGTLSEKIIFESNNSSQNKSDWSGIRIRPSSSTSTDGNQDYSSGSQFKYVTIKYADIGLYVYDTGLHTSYTTFENNNIGFEIRKTDGVVIDNSTFQNNNLGIWSEYEIYTNDITGHIKNTYIRYSVFSNNGNAIDLVINQRDFSNLNIFKNIFTGNNIGIDFGGGGYGPRVHSVLISENIVYNSSIYGVNLGRVYGEGTGTSLDYPLEFTKNIIVNNDGGSLMFESSSVKFKIHKNILVSNVADVNCIASIGSPSTSNHLFNKNTIISKGKNVYFGGSDSYHANNINFTNNLFGNSSNNDIIDIKYGAGHVFNNNNLINQSSTGYFLKNQTANSVNAENNYWGTTADSEIQALIYDFDDDFELGEIDYQPFSNTLNINAPISPPMNVTKIVQGNDVVLSWTANSESDLAGYKLYYGNPTGYSYDNSIEIGNVTTYTISGGDINTEYAITSYDSSADGLDDQVNGNESWFSISINDDSLTDKNFIDFDDVLLYPNPTTSIVTLQGDKQYDIEVYTLQGKKVMALTGNTIDMSHLSSATYIVKALDKVENEEVSYKVVKN